MCNVDESKKIVEILEFQCFTNVIAFRKNNKNCINKVQKDSVKVSMAEDVVGESAQKFSEEKGGETVFDSNFFKKLNFFSPFRRKDVGIGR